MIFRGILKKGSVSIPSNRGKLPDPAKGNHIDRGNPVSIPSNRGKLPDKTIFVNQMKKENSLNPLKSGQTSGLKDNIGSVV